MHTVPITINARVHTVPITINARVHTVPITYHSPQLCRSSVTTIIRTTQKVSGNADSLFTNSAIVRRIYLWHCRSDISVYSANTQISVAPDIIPFLNFRVFSTLPSKRTKRLCSNFPISGLYSPPFCTSEHRNFKTSLAVNCTLTD